MSTLRELARHISYPPPASFTVRELLGRNQGVLTIKPCTTYFSIMTQNMALMVAPKGYAGTDREGAVRAIIKSIETLAPDVVGLCEVFADDEREAIRLALASRYPYFMEGPENSGLSDGGCLLLSKYPKLAEAQLVYSDAVAPDKHADKGVLYMRVQPPMARRPYDIFYSHAQNIDEAGGQNALYKQMSVMGEWIEMVKLTAERNNPTFALGDLNVPGNEPKRYTQLISRLRHPLDLWLVSGGAPDIGYTLASDNDFYEDPDENPQQNRRLDYILMWPGRKVVPIINRFEILKLKVNGRDLSDHFGLRAVFEETVEVDF
jgi:endonuclease/exonuclease/phosphatase family metal-dependent hydrolase